MRNHRNSKTRTERDDVPNLVHTRTQLEKIIATAIIGEYQDR